MYYILIAVLGIMFVGCICGLVLSARHTAKVKKLQASADYNFKTENGSYSFIYAIKAFKTDEGKKVKIVFHPVLGFSDLATGATNTCLKVDATVKDKRTGAETTCDTLTDLHTLDVNYTINVPESYMNAEGIADLEIVVTSEWSLGATPIKETLSFDFNK